MSQTAITSVLLLLLAAIIAVPLFQRIKAGAILGYLVAGILLGPYGFSLFSDIADMRHLAEFGVVFLLFAIGLEMRIEHLWRARRQVFGLGFLQMALTTAAFVVILMYGLGYSLTISVIMGSGLSISCTAMIARVLMDRDAMASNVGRLSISILLFQDLSAVPLLVLVSILGSGTGETTDFMSMAEVTGKAIVVLGGIILFGRYGLRPILNYIASHGGTEIFSATAIFVVLGTSWLTASVGLSMGMGAFLAGLLLAGTEFKHQFEADIMPFRSLLLGLFFMTVGMAVDLSLLFDQYVTIILGLLGFLAVRISVFFAIMHWLARRNAPKSMQAALLLAQGGEFSFVLFDLAVNDNVVPALLGSQATLIASLSILITPLLAHIAFWFSRRIPLPTDTKAATPDANTTKHENHIIIAGYGRVGQAVAHMLDASDVPFVALDVLPERIATGRRQGIPVYFADAGRHEVYQTIGADKAKAIVITIKHAARAEKTVALLRRWYPTIPIYARAHDQAASQNLIEAGATHTVPETVESSLQLGASVLEAVGSSTDDIGLLLDNLRENNYAALKPLMDKTRADHRQSRGR